MKENFLEKLRLQHLKDVRLIVLLLVVGNVSLFVVAIISAIVTSHTTCPRVVMVGVAIMATGASMRVVWLMGMGCMQAATAAVMIGQKQQIAPQGVGCGGTVSKNDRQLWYRRWLWWSRMGLIVTSLQIVGATYLIYVVVKHDHEISNDGGGGNWLRTVLIVLPVVGWALLVVQCCAGSDVMAWRSLYKTYNEAWRAHYREMFDYGIREALCCLGRSCYLGERQKDEVEAVAALLGDLVAYRAAGASHLELLAGVSMLRNQSPPRPSYHEKPVPEALLREASILHPYAVAAYTGPLLDVGRHPFMWLCMWFYRQGVLTPWNYNRRPRLEGDNCWRGHAAAFLKLARLPPEALQKGRVLQTNRETVYFVVVLDKLRTVLVTIRGTETPEDLLTDGLSKESPLSESDLLGLLKGPGISEEVRQQVKETMPHHAHDGIIEAARELSMQLDNLAEDDNDAMAASDCASITGRTGSEGPLRGAQKGLLSELLGPGGKCRGYHLRFVGHSLGGAIGALTGLMLYRRFPDLHVYAFGVLPCVDSVIAQACEKFITSVVYNDEFSSRLSVSSIMRLRADALKALAKDADRDLARVGHLSGGNEPSNNNFENPSSSPSRSSSNHSNLFSCESESNGEVLSDRLSGLPFVRQKRPEKRKRRRVPYMLKGGAFLCAHTCFCMFKMSQHHKAGATSTEIEHAVLALAVKPSGDGSVETWPRCQGMCRDEELELGVIDYRFGKDARVTLVPPVPPKLPSMVKDIESRGESFSDQLVAGQETSNSRRLADEVNEGRLSLTLSIPRQQSSCEKEIVEDPERRENRDSEGPIDSKLRPNGMPKDIGCDYIGFESGSDLQQLWPVEMFVPGLVIHLVREEKPTGVSSWISSFWYTWRAEGNSTKYRAILTDRNCLRNIVVSPAMFIDHMPWKCQHALNLVVKQLNTPQQQIPPNSHPLEIV